MRPPLNRLPHMVACPHAKLVTIFFISVGLKPTVSDGRKSLDIHTRSLTRSESQQAATLHGCSSSSYLSGTVEVTPHQRQ